MTCPYPDFKNRHDCIRCPAMEDCPGDVDEPQAAATATMPLECRMLRVYVAGPLSGREVDYIANCAALDSASAEVVALGMAPFNPAADRCFGQFLPEPLDAGTYKELSFAWLAASDVMYVSGRVSPGVQAEVEFCARRGIPVVYSLDELAEMRGTEP